MYSINLLYASYYNNYKFSFAVSIWLVGPSIALYYATVPFLLYSFPRSFTLGEAVIVGQGTTLLLLDTAVQLLKLVKKNESFICGSF